MIIIISFYFELKKFFYNKPVLPFSMKKLLKNAPKRREL